MSQVYYGAGERHDKEVKEIPKKRVIATKIVLKKINGIPKEEYLAAKKAAK